MLKRILLLFSILLFILILIGYNRFRVSYNGTVKLSVKEPVSIKYDSFGIPHIYASNISDAYKALGFAHAKDRLFQMDLMRRVGSGTLAQLMGDDVLDVDIFFRTLGVSEHAKTSSENFQKKHGKTEFYSAANAYLEGINAFIDSEKLPIEYTFLNQKPRHFTLDDVHATIGYMSFTFAMAIKTEPLLTGIAKHLGEEYLSVLAVHSLPNQTKIPVFYPFDSTLNTQTEKQISSLQTLNKIPVPLFIGSNSWIISGSKSKNGKPIFCNDTHIGFSQPSVWYEAHIETPEINFYGNYLAGVPFALIGHSLEHSFGLTMFENDDFDFYIEQYHNKEFTHFIYDSIPYEAKYKKDSIPLKNGSYKFITITKSKHGNIVNSIIPEIEKVTTNPVAAWWVFLAEPSEALHATWIMNHPENLNHFEEGVALIHAPGLNVMYADKSDNIAWWAAAKLAERPMHVNSKLFIDGTCSKNSVLGWYPFSENPRSINPSTGFIFSANNQPDTLRNGVLYPGHYYPGYRAQRIIDFLSEKDDWQQEDMKEMLLDTYTKHHVVNCKILVAALKESYVSQYPEIIDMLENWDGFHGLNQTAPTFYYKWVHETLRLKMEDELGEEGFNQFLQTFVRNRSMTNLLKDGSSIWWNNITTDKKETKNDIINRAFEHTVNFLFNNMGRELNQWQWHKASSLVHEHPLGAVKPLNKLFNVKTSAVEANDGGLNKLEFLLNGNGLYPVKSGPAMRIIIDFSQVEKSESILPTGQSGNVFSKHYKDQAELFVQGKFRPQLMLKEDIEKQKQAEIKINPLN